MNAITLLKNEHEKVKKQLTHIESILSQPEDKKLLFSALCADIIRHEQMEHTVWYPHFNNNKKLDQTVSHLISEEKHAENSIDKFKTLKTENEWDEMFLKFKNEVEHHANEEETKLFPHVIKLFTTEELDEIGNEMKEFNEGVLTK